MYSGEVPIVLKLPEREDRRSTLTVDIVYSTTQPRNQKVLQIQLTDESDAYLLYTLDISEDEFHTIKTDQSIRSDKLDISFKVYLGNSAAGRYGLALTMLDAERMTSLEGGGASGMGYSGLPGWSIEFNTSTGSVGFVIDGNREQIQHATQLPSAKDGLWHDVDIMMEGNTLTVYYDDMLLINGTVEGNTTFPGYIGFSAATDDWVNTHKVADLTMNLTPCE